jgi:uncharacterized circularly permuted ATP-grasp superfamily protein
LATQPCRSSSPLTNGRHRRRRGQRADLLETVVADLYGRTDLVAEGICRQAGGRQSGMAAPAGRRDARVPAISCISSLSRSVADLTAAGGFLATGRKLPPVRAYALENRVATMRTFNDFYNQAQCGAAGRFLPCFPRQAEWRSPKDGSRVGILTPGPMNDTYFEHAYIARYLGIMLLEGDDLVGRNGG